MIFNFDRPGAEYKGTIVTSDVKRFPTTVKFVRGEESVLYLELSAHEMGKDIAGVEITGVVEEEDTDEKIRNLEQTIFSLQAEVTKLKEGQKDE